jgi:two-component system sensor histidine kinase/response regulator
MISRIFNEFEQVEGAANRKFEGTGLGLAISTRLIKLMDGNISATSTVGKGSEFTVELMLLPSDRLVQNEAENDIDVRGIKALVVDDLLVNRTILSERLASWGVKSIIAASGEEALHCLKSAVRAEDRIDVVITDFQMPGMDGETLCKQVRETHGYQNTPIIILSSVDQSITPAIRHEIGKCELLLKPVRSSHFGAVLRKSLKSNDFRSVQTAAAAPTIKPQVFMKPVQVLAGQMTLLVAEDNKTNQLVVKTMLKGAPVNLVFANNGVEAVKLFKELKPDMVFMDMSMPQMDGVEATMRIREEECLMQAPACPIIALTANAMSHDRERCERAGMNGFLAKPIKKAQLMEAVAKWGHMLDEVVA